MDKKQRYNEPKKVWDILKDMKMDPESLKSRQEATQTHTVDAIMKNLEIYITYMNELAVLHKKSANLITWIDNRSTQEQATLSNMQKNMTQWRIKRLDILNKIQNIQSYLSNVEIYELSIKKSFCKIIDALDSEEEKQQHIEKLAAFSCLYTDIYVEICGFYQEYINLLKLIPK